MGFYYIHRHVFRPYRTHQCGSNGILSHQLLLVKSATNRGLWMHDVQNPNPNVYFFKNIEKLKQYFVDKITVQWKIQDQGGTMTKCVMKLLTEISQTPR